MTALRILIVLLSMMSLAFADGRQILKCYSVPKQDLENPIGLMDPGTKLHLAITIPLRDQAGLDRFNQSVSDPKSPNYGHFLSPQEYAQRFGATDSDYNAIVDFFKGKGFVVTTYPNHLLVDADGTVSMVEVTFHVKLRQYKHPTEDRDFYAPDGNPSVDLDIPLSGITGLDNFIRIRPLHTDSRLKPLQ